MGTCGIFNSDNQLATLSGPIPGNETGLEVVQRLEKRGVVIYDTRFGNTEEIAGALARGIRRHIEADCLNIKDVDLGKLSDYTLIAMGAPTEAFSASKPMKEFMSKLLEKNLAGRYGFAFDTRYDSRLSGSAAKYIEGGLLRIGMNIVKPRASAFVEGRNEAVRLKDGEEQKFEDLGAAIGTALQGKDALAKG